MHDEERITLAPGVALRAIATPGHTPDHHCYLLEQAGAPAARSRGGSLMVGAVGRTDLCGPRGKCRQLLAHDMFPRCAASTACPTTWPCTRPTGLARSAPRPAARSAPRRSVERATNHLFRIDDEDRFVEQLLAGSDRSPPTSLYCLSSTGGDPAASRSFLGSTGSTSTPSSTTSTPAP